MLLPPDPVTGVLIQRLGSLYHRLGNEFGDRPLVLPNGAFFPDPFSGDEDSVEMLLRRMQSHAGLSDIPLELRIIAQGCADCDGKCGHGDAACGCKHGNAAHKSCGTGTCGSCGPELQEPVTDPRLVDLGDGWRIQIPATELANSIVLTANLAKSLGLIFLLDTRPAGQALAESNLDIACETAAVALGFGGLLLAASYVYAKSCGGPRVAQITKLSCGELALLTVLFAQRGGHKVRGLRKLLGVTQASALDEAVELLRNNPSIVEDLRTRPHELAAGNFTLSRDGSFWTRWFKPKRDDSQPQNASAEFDIGELEAALRSRDSVQRAARGAASKPQQDDLRELVDEALTEVTREGA